MRYLPILLILAACTTAPVYLKHPQTGAVVNCGGYPAGGWAATAGALREAKCIDDYRSQGYVRVPGEGK